MNTDSEHQADQIEPGEIEAEGAIDPEAAHMLDFRIPEAEGEADQGDEFTEVDESGQEIERPTEPQRMTLEAFQATIRWAWSIPGYIRADLKALAVDDPGKAEACDEFSAATFELVEKQFPWLIDHSSPSFQLLARMAPFLVMQGLTIKAIAEARRAERAAAQAEFRSQRAQAANENRPPEAEPVAPGNFDWMNDEQGAAA